MSAPLHNVESEIGPLSSDTICQVLQSLEVVSVDHKDRENKSEEEIPPMYLPVLIQNNQGEARITLALPDSGNLLAHTAINAKFHQSLGIQTRRTDIRARSANKQALQIVGVSEGIYLRIPGVIKVFFIRPLVVHNLSCNLNLGAQFNFKTGLIPQIVQVTEDGKKISCVRLGKVYIELQRQDVTIRELRKIVKDNEFVRSLKAAPPDYRCGLDAGKSPQHP